MTNEHAPETYEEAYARLKDSVYDDIVCMGEFLDWLGDSAMLIELLRSFQCQEAGSVEALRGFVDDAIDRYCQEKADQSRFTPTRGRPDPKVLNQLLADLHSGKAFGMLPKP